MCNLCLSVIHSFTHSVSLSLSLSLSVSFPSECNGAYLGMNRFYKFMSFALEDPPNNLAELDKAVPGMVDRKIFSIHRPTEGLMFVDAENAVLILQNEYLVHFLFQSRISPKKHEWSTHNLSVEWLHWI